MKKLIKKFYSHFRKHRESDLLNHVTKRTKDVVTQELLKQKFLCNSEKLLNNDSRKQKLVVSLTTFGGRIKSAYLPIESIGQQSFKPDEIVLWLDQTKFSNENLPLSLKRLMRRGLKVKYCQDLGPHTKLIHALKDYPDDLIVTIDDDHIYPMDMLENLIMTHKKHPRTICCNVARRITKNDNDDYSPYTKWDKLHSKEYCSNELLPLGVNGVLYFPGCFDSEVFNFKNIKILAPKADDIWFKAMHHKNNVSCIITGAYPVIRSQFTQLESERIDPLAQYNMSKNVKQLKDVFDYYGLTI
ncbi:glycosyltransferase [Rhodohalobacter barkolensis]|uniref:Glycosyltransferase 2-like domain-containing protein n=1 Tax=Rhodohalobacter barkolensis TaxID=2053187 RepID=A0A2N0VGE9_9BACT|nr:glycosyltransferase [Rhodohalobacter barkolensis]PKD43272.1 hypothetical protein CWD77_11700 [Rhodohalobacter barkolensis]